MVDERAGRLVMAPPVTGRGVLLGHALPVVPLGPSRTQPTLSRKTLSDREVTWPGQGVRHMDCH